MGLPLRTPSRQKRPRIPTADAIIAMRRQRHQDESEDERFIQTAASVPHLVTPEDSQVKNHLPVIMPKTQSVGSLADLKETRRKHHKETPVKNKTIGSNQQQPQNSQHQSLPFFRGNMLVEGHGQR